MKTVSLRGAAVEPVKNSAMSVRSKYSYTEQLSTMQTAKQLRLSVAVVSHAALPAVMAEVQGLGNTRLRKKIHDMNRQLSSNTSHVCQENLNRHETKTIATRINVQAIGRSTHSKTVQVRQPDGITQQPMKLVSCRSQ